MIRARDGGFLLLRRARSTVGLLFLLFLLVEKPAAARIPSCGAFCTSHPPSLSLDNAVGRTQPTTTTATPYRGVCNSPQAGSTIVSQRMEPANRNNLGGGLCRLGMAAPGMSDAQRKNERDFEIRATMAKLKREGKLKNNNNDDGGKQLSPEDSAIQEAEAFFNKPSPFKKFQERKAERDRIATENEIANSEKKKDPDQ